MWIEKFDLTRRKAILGWENEARGGKAKGNYFRWRKTLKFKSAALPYKNDIVLHPKNGRGVGTDTDV